MPDAAKTPPIDIAWLNRTDLFGALSDDDLEALLPQFERVELHAQSVLFSEGGPGDALYVIVTGRLRVYLETESEVVGGRQRLLREMVAGEVLGEMSVISGGTRTASVAATRDSLLLRLTRVAFEAIVEAHPHTVLQVARIIVDRLSRPGGLVESEAASVLALVPLSNDVDTDRFALLVRKSLNALGSATTIDQETFLEQMYAGKSSEETDLYYAQTAMADGLERENDFVVLQARLDDSEWTRSTLRQADRILLLAHAHDSAQPSEAEVKLFTDTPFAGRRDLVLLHTEGQPQSDPIFKWLEQRDLVGHHHLRWDSSLDLDRLTRLVSGADEGLRWLEACQLFSSLNKAQLRTILPEFRWHMLDAQEVLFEKGDLGDSLFIIVSGRLQAFVRLPGPDGEEHLQIFRDMGPGSVIGEMALITNQARTASIRAIRDSIVVQLSREAFMRITNNHPDILWKVSNVVIGRALGQGGDGAAHTSIGIVVLPIGPSVDVGAFTRKLEKALSEQGRTFTVNASILDQQLGAGSAAVGKASAGDAIIREWLANLEEAHDFLVYGADNSDTPWTRRCLRQADRVLLVAGADDPKALTAIERDLLEGATSTPARRELVLIQPDNTRPDRTSEWLANRTVDAHHHLRWSRDTDFGRVARLVTDQAVGLALGGGGSRGVAHLGVVRAIREAGVPIDVITGTSAGACMGGLVALEFDDQTAMARIHNLLSKVFGHVASMAPPLVSLMSGAHNRRILEEIYDGARMEDLFVPFQAVAANLTAAQLTVLNRGPVWRAVRASASLPGVWPPVLQGSDLLVDGGVLNNLPSDLLRGPCERGRIIACNISATRDPVVYDDYGDSVNGWRVLAGKLNPLGQTPKVPTLYGVIEQCIILGSRNQLTTTVKRDVHLYLEPPIGHLGMFDVRGEDVIAMVEQAGYAHATEKLADWDWR